MLGIAPYMLARYAHNRDQYYKVFRVPKSSGIGVRTIAAPCREFKGIQRWVIRYVLDHVSLHENAMAYRSGLSIYDNAQQHIQQEFVLNLDIRNFFPSITDQRIYGMFLSLDYSQSVSWLLTRLVTYRGRLPQGAPSSPMISNIICRRLDMRITAYADLYEWRYTRYCDDITISGAGSLGWAIKFVSTMISDEGFEVNRQKVRVARRGKSQRVTGLVVNDDVKVPRVRRRQIRSLFYHASQSPNEYLGRYSEMCGLYSFLKMIDPDDASLSAYKEVLEEMEKVSY